MRRTWAASLPAILIMILACNLPAASPDQLALDLTSTAQASADDETAAATSSLTPTPTLPVASSTTPAASTALPCNAASFVADVTVPDGTVIDADTDFSKTWKLKNVGSCAWTSGYELVFDSGDQMGGPSSQRLTNGTVPPGENINVQVDLHSPDLSGTYKGSWKLRDPNGTRFGLSTGPFWVQIKVQSAPAALPDWPIRKSGNTGPEVFALQYLLVAQGEVLTVDGNFGPVTKSRVQHFQALNGLTADGIVGPDTWPKLILQVQLGSHSDAVRAVQILLDDKFAYSLPVDGIFGSDTADAVKEYQGGHGLTADGIVGPNTWRALLVVE